MSHRVLAAGIVRDLEFPSFSDFMNYLLQFHSSAAFTIMNYVDLPDGRCTVRLVTKYSDSPMIDLSE